MWAGKRTAPTCLNRIVVCPCHQFRGFGMIGRVNHVIHEHSASVERFGWRFQMRDKVIQTENDYDKDVFNGDVGFFERLDMVEQQVAIRFDDRIVKYDVGELDKVSLAYAVTIHKSQGSEFPYPSGEYRS